MPQTPPAGRPSVRQLAAAQQADLHEKDASYQRYDQDLAPLRGRATPGGPRVIEDPRAASPNTGVRVAKEVEEQAQRSAKMRAQLAESYSAQGDGDAAFDRYRAEPLGSGEAAALARDPGDERQVDITVHAQLPGDPCLHAAADRRLGAEVAADRAAVAAGWGAGVASAAPSFITADEGCSRVHVQRAELWAFHLIEERYHRKTIDSALYRARYAAANIANEGLPEEEEEEELLARTEDCVRLYSIKRRIVDAEYRARGISAVRRDELARQKVAAARALGEHVRRAMVANAELLLMQERRLQLIDRHEEVEHWREYCAYDSLDNSEFRVARGELQEMALIREGTENRIRRLRFRVETLDETWAAARGDLLALGAAGQDPVEVAWAEAHARRERAIAAAEARVAELVAEREVEERARLALVTRPDDDDDAAAAAAAERGRARAREEKAEQGRAEEARRASRASPAAEALADRAARELREEHSADVARERHVRLGPLVCDLEPLLLPYDTPPREQDPIAAELAQGRVALPAVYRNMCTANRCKPNQMVAEMLRNPYAEEVDLSAVCIGRNLLTLVLDMAQLMPRLRRVSVARCDVDNAQWARMAPRLRRMRHLVDLDVGGNPALCDWESLLEFLRGSWRVTSLRYKGLSFFPSSGGQRLRQQLLANREAVAREVARDAAR